MINPHDSKAIENKYGFVFGNGTLDKAWSLAPNATKDWLLVA